MHPLLRKILDPPLYVHVKSQFQGKKPVFPLRNFRLLYYPGILQQLQHLIIQFPLYYLLVVAYRRLKTKRNFTLLALKVVAVAYERWSLTRGFQCTDLAEKLLVNWLLRRGGRNWRFDCNLSVILRRPLISGPEQDISSCVSMVMQCTEKIHGLWPIAELFCWEGKHLSMWVKITLGEWILRVTCLNGEYYQN